MSYDLSFCVTAGTPAPAWTEYEEYFRSRAWYRIQERRRAFYGNEDTGVYFWFESAPAEPGTGTSSAGSAPQEGLEPAGLTFELNYMRPHVFALEAERELRALVERFKLRVDDSQIGGMGRGLYSADGFLSGWNTGNELGYRAVVEQIRNDPADDSVWTLPSAELERCWRWNLQRNELQESLGRDVFVPRISFASREKRVQTFLVWGDAMPIALPEVDLLVLVRQRLAPRSLLFFRKQDMAVVPFAELGALLSIAGREASPLPHHLFRFDRPPEQLIRFFSDRPPTTAGLAGVTVDKILDGELLDAARSAPPLETLNLDGQDE